MTKKKKVFVEYFINPPLHQNIFYCTSLKKLILALAKYKYIFFPIDYHCSWNKMMDC